MLPLSAVSSWDYYVLGSGIPKNKTSFPTSEDSFRIPGFISSFSQTLLYGHVPDLSEDKIQCEKVGEDAVGAILLMVQKSQTTIWDVQTFVNTGINYLLTAAGFLPSTV